MEEMNKFVDLVDRMMQMQESFFHSDKNSSQRSFYLMESKKLERETKEFIKKYKGQTNQTNLF